VHYLLGALAQGLGAPVEVEFASDGTDLYLLQCRRMPSATAASAALSHADLAWRDDGLAPPSRQESPEAQSRWRIRVAEHIAASTNPEQWGVVAMYLASAGAAAADPSAGGPDATHNGIDLIVHVAGSEQQRRGLGHWLDGWRAALGEADEASGNKAAGPALNIRYVTDADLSSSEDLARAILAPTDGAKLLPLGAFVRVADGDFNNDTLTAAIRAC